MLLGAIMTQFQDEETAADALLSLGDIILLAQVEAARQAHDESVGAYVSGAAQRFSRQASDEDWLGLMTALERTSNPAASCLTTMVRWSMTQDATVLHANGAVGRCSCGNGHDGRQG